MLFKKFLLSSSDETILMPTHSESALHSSPWVSLSDLRARCSLPGFSQALWKRSPANSIHSNSEWILSHWLYTQPAHVGNGMIVEWRTDVRSPSNNFRALSLIASLRVAGKQIYMWHLPCKTHIAWNVSPVRYVLAWDRMTNHKIHIGDIMNTHVLILEKMRSMSSQMVSLGLSCILLTKYPCCWHYSNSEQFNQT